MNDSFNDKNGSKVKVMYVRPEEESKRRRSSWQERFRDNEQRPSFAAKEGDGAHDEQGKTALNPAQIRRQRQEETRIYGENACQAMFTNRPEGIVRGYFLQSVSPRFRDALRWMAANRKAYHIVDDAEMQKISGSEHHGGVCFLIKKRSGVSVTDYLAKSKKKDCILVLDQIPNPFNLGGVIRSAAFFGVNGVVVRNIDHLESGATTRTADGGMEHMQPVIAEDLELAVDSFRQKGYFVVGLSTQAVTKDSVPFNQLKLPAKTVIVISQYNNQAMSQHCDRLIHVQATSQVESLNISVASGIVLAEWYNQNH